MKKIITIVSSGLLLIFISSKEIQHGMLQFLTGSDSEVLYQRIPLWELCIQHLQLTGLAALFSIAIGFSLGLAGAKSGINELKKIILSAAGLAQSFPPVAVIALTVPFAGYGFSAVFAALVLYGILPIIGNTLKGFDSIDSMVLYAAESSGMTKRQMFFLIELPLAAPIITAGIRTSVVINIGTATIGAVAGAGGLGAPIISGLVQFNSAIVLQGAIPTALLALSVDGILAFVQERLTPVHNKYIH